MKRFIAKRIISVIPCLLYTSWQIGDIYISGNARKTEDNPQGLGCYLVMTGRGCDDIFRILDNRNLTFGDMFWHCERRYGLDNFHFTRLDVAIDDRNEKPFFICSMVKNGFSFLSSIDVYKRQLSHIVNYTAKTSVIAPTEKR